MTDYQQTNIEKLTSEFIELTLPREQWTHEAHLIVAFWHNIKYPATDALTLIRERIKAYNVSIGNENTVTSGYHETLTVYWMKLTRKYIHDHPDLNLSELITSFLKNELSYKSSAFEYYSRYILFSQKARQEFVDGDICSLSTLDLQPTN